MEKKKETHAALSPDLAYVLVLILENNANSSRSFFYQKYYAKYFPLQ